MNAKLWATSLLAALLGGALVAAGGARAAGPRAADGEKNRLEITLPDLPELPNVSERLDRFAPRGWLGVGLRCRECRITVDEKTGTPRWRFRSSPEIYSLDADGPAAKAGLQVGDVFKSIDGTVLTTSEGGKRFGAVAPGDTVRLTVERDGKKRDVTVIAEENPEGDVFAITPEIREEMRGALDRLREERKRLAVERDHIVQEHRRDLDQDERRALERQLEAAERDIMRSTESLQRQLEQLARRYSTWSPEIPDAPEAPSPPGAPESTRGSRPLRYEGMLGGSEIEVRGSSAVVVREEDAKGTLVITTPDATIRIRKTK